jgi:DNA-binding NtrC family response regulator
VGVSRWAAEARAAVAAHAAHDEPVILEGEAGAGKEFLARLIHECSHRRYGPFIAISCGALSEESVEAVLFGSVRILSSGRNRIQRGLVEAARGGTLYIDGAAALSPTLKTEIARLIQHQEFRRVGEMMLEPAHVRVVLGRGAAADDARGGAGVMTVNDSFSVAPLRRRKADIEPLSRCFVEQFCRGLRKEARELVPETISLLRRYDWPGNTAELKKVIEEMVAQSKPPSLDPSLLPAHLFDTSEVGYYPFPVSGINLSQEVERMERAHLCAALRQCQGVQSKAAQLLGLKPTTLNAKLKQYGIDVTLFKSPTDAKE